MRNKGVLVISHLVTVAQREQGTVYNRPMCLTTAQRDQVVSLGVSYCGRRWSDRLLTWLDTACQLQHVRVSVPHLLVGSFLYETVHVTFTLISSYWRVHMKDSERFITLRTFPQVWPSGPLLQSFGLIFLRTRDCPQDTCLVADSNQGPLSILHSGTVLLTSSGCL